MLLVWQIESVAFNGEILSFFWYQVEKLATIHSTEITEVWWDISSIILILHIHMKGSLSSVLYFKMWQCQIFLCVKPSWPFCTEDTQLSSVQLQYKPRVSGSEYTIIWQLCKQPSWRHLRAMYFSFVVSVSQKISTLFPSVLQVLH